MHHRSSVWHRLFGGAGAVLFCVLFLSGCATPLTDALRGRAPEGVRQIELSATPYFPQVDYFCGPAALAALLQNNGGKQSPEQLVPQVYLPGRQGSLQIELLAAARRQGQLATVIPGNFSALLDELRAGNPVLVLQNLGLGWAPNWHYAVVIGVDPDAEAFILRSGSEPRQRMGYKLFERTWARGGHWAMVVTPPDRLPASSQEREQAQAIAALERLDPRAALLAYPRAAERWPHAAVFRVGQANARFNLGDIAGAADVLLELLSREPDNAIALNNLANLRLKLGDAVLARRYAERAAQMAGPWQAAAIATLREIEAADRRQGGDTPIREKTARPPPDDAAAASAQPARKSSD